MTQKPTAPFPRQFGTSAFDPTTAVNGIPLLFPLLMLGTTPALAEIEIVPLTPHAGVTTPLHKTMEIEPRGTAVEAIMPTAGGLEALPGAAEGRPLTSPESREQSYPAPSPTPRPARTPAKPVAASSAKPGKETPPPPPPPNAAPAASVEVDPLVRYNNLVQSAITAFDAKRYDEAYRILKDLREDITNYSDIGMLALLGLAAMQVGDEETSLGALREAAELTEDDQFYQPLADALLHFKHIDEAEQVLGKMSPSPERDQRLATLAILRAQAAYEGGRYVEAENILLDGHERLDAGGLELLGWIQYRLGKLDAAADQFERAYRMKPAQGSAQGLVFSLHRLKQYSRLLLVAEEQPGPLDMLVSPEVRQQIAAGASRFTVDSEGRLGLAAGGGDAAPGHKITVELAPNVRNKRGIPGEGKLSQSSLALTTTWHGERDQVSIQVTGERADDSMEEARGQRFYALWRHHAENGFEYRLGLGRSLSGGAVDAAMLGEAGVGYYTADWGLGGRLFRRGNEESLLALAGKPHPTILGEAWGRVLETGLSLDGYIRLGEWNALASLTASKLEGEGVADNRKLELYSRALHPVTAIAGLSLGPELYASHFDKNLSAFEPGHGGYFSPDSFLKLGALASYEGRIDKLELQMLGGIGWSWSQQNATAGNPLTGEAPGKYPATSDHGLAYHGSIEGLWPLNANWNIGFTLGGQESPDYNDWRAGVYAQRGWGN